MRITVALNIKSHHMHMHTAWHGRGLCVRALFGALIVIGSDEVECPEGRLIEKDSRPGLHILNKLADGLGVGLWYSVNRISTVS